MATVNKLTQEYQSRWLGKPIFNDSLLSHIDEKVQLHKALHNPLSSAAACLNVLSNIKDNPTDIKQFFRCFSLEIDQVIKFPTGVSVQDEVYNDIGPIVFEWIGPQLSPIYEKTGSRGKYKTSIDAYLLARIAGKTTQLLIEWKFTEDYSSKSYNHKFSGLQGNERLRRYSSVLATLRKENRVPFNLTDEGKLGLYDFSYEPLYQLLRMTLLAKMTTPLKLNDDILIDDYKIVHLTHSNNEAVKYLKADYLEYSPGLRLHSGRELHDVWRNEILAPDERDHFVSGYWNQALSQLSISKVRDYLIERYA